MLGLTHLPDFRAIAARKIAMFHGYATYALKQNLVQITARPQLMAFRPESESGCVQFVVVRLLIAQSRANRWRIHDIKIANQSQFRSPTPLRGDVFTAAGSTEPAPVLVFDLQGMQVDQDIQITVEYVGDDPEGEAFVALLVGSGSAGNARSMLSLSSATRVLPSTEGVRVVLDLDDQRFVCVTKHDTQGPQLQRLYVCDRSTEDLLCPDSVAAVTIVPPAPITVSLHVAVVPGFAGGVAQVLFGLDERNDCVLFELAHNPFAAYGPMFRSRCEIDGYLPVWWNDAGVTIEGQRAVARGLT